MKPTASPLLRRSSTSFASAPAVTLAARVQSSRPSALMAPTTPTMVTTPIASPSPISRRNARRGSP